LGRRCKIDVAEIKAIAVESLLGRFGEHLEAVALFGSWARGEAAELSDLDFFVVVDRLPKEPVRRRYMVCDALTHVSRRFGCEVSVVEADAEQFGKEVTPLLMNIAHDGVILYDRAGRIEELLKRVKDAVKRAGLVRYKTSDGKYGWRPSHELKAGEVFTVQLQG